MKKEYLKFLIPVVAVLVIIESVILVGRLTEKQPMLSDEPEVLVEETETETVADEPVMAEVEMVFGVETKQMKRGENYVVRLSVVPKVNVGVDAIDIYVNYDPTGFEVSKLSGGEELIDPAVLLDSKKKPGLLVANYYISQGGGYKLVVGESVEVMSFVVKPLKAGSYDFKVAGGQMDKESVTMFVETKTGRVVPVESNNLEVEVL